MVTIRAVAAGGLAEGDYTSWTKKWINSPNGGLSSLYEMDALINDKNDTLSILYTDKNNKKRFCIYNLSDFSVVYESPVDSHYTHLTPVLSTKEALHMGMSYFAYNGASQSAQTYLLLLRNGQDTIEVWRGGASALWSTNTQTDFGTSSDCDAGGISITGKYILVGMYQDISPYLRTLMLYEGE